MQALYQADVARIVPAEAFLATCACTPLHADTLEFARDLIEGVSAHRPELEADVASALAKGWSLGRIAIVDRAILLLGAYELRFLPDMPPKVTIDQAVNLAKRFGSAESGAFVNGVLGALLARSDKARWTPTNDPTEDVEPPEPESVPEEPEVVEGSPEFEALRDLGPWTIRSEDAQ